MPEAKDDFEIYLEKYCVKHGITPEEAKKHRMIQDVKAYYEEKGGTTCGP